MNEKQRVIQRCVGELEAALLEYTEKFGPTENAKLAISRLTIARAVFGSELDQ